MEKSMRSLRFAVALLQALAVAVALIASCPCQAPAPNSAADAHACCPQTRTALAAASEGCCDHCGITTAPSSAEPASDTTTLVVSAVVEVGTVALDSPIDTARLQPPVFASSPPSAPTPLRI